MMCAWKQLLSVLPPRLRPEVDRLGKNALQELRLRLGMPPELVLSGESRWLGCCVSREDLNYCINAASRYSPWAAATTAQGYLTAPGGHRIGLCGEVVCKDGIVTGIREISSLCIRVARDFPGIAKRAADAPGSILILGAPGWGKTTLLRDLIRQIGEKQCVSVVDERGELFPEGWNGGRRRMSSPAAPSPRESTWCSEPWGRTASPWTRSRRRRTPGRFSGRQTAACGCWRPPTARRRRTCGAGRSTVRWRKVGCSKRF